jgi:small nuclear ribonucleoprotein (snRNP)-like protein
VRGVCQGYLRAFDRHMNLVLAEAEETFLVLPPRPKEATHHKRTEQR